MIKRIKHKIQSILSREKAPARALRKQRAQADSYATAQRTRVTKNGRVSPLATPKAANTASERPTSPPTPRKQAVALLDSDASEARERGLDLLDRTEPDAKLVALLLHSAHANVRDYAMRKYVALVGIDGAAAMMTAHVAHEDEPIIKQFVFDKALELIQSVSVDRREQGFRLLDRVNPDTLQLEGLTHSPYGVVRDYAIRNYVRHIGLGAARERLLHMQKDDEPQIRSLVREYLDRLGE